MPDIKSGDNTFGYAEIRTGTRAVKIWVKGQERSPQEYKFNPDPHLDPWYNKNQAKFYLAAATDLANTFATKGSFPRFGAAKVTINKIVYKLEKP